MGNYYGLLVGVGEYENISKLYKTNKDASDLYKSLIAAGYPEGNLRLLLDKDATVNKISMGLDWLARVAHDEQDTVIIFFSGHGVRFEGGLWSGEFLCPVEANINQRDPRSTLIASEDFSRALRSIRSGRMAVLLDACHAGGVGEVKDALIDARAGLSENTYSKLAMSKGRVIIASSKTDEPSFELKEMENGLFTHHLLEGLQGKAALSNGVISITSLFSHVYHRVSQTKSQHPFMKFDGEDFAIARLSDSVMSDSLPEKADGSKVKESYIDIDSEHFTYEQAESILANLYQKFHGRELDDTARSDLIPLLQKYGFIGLGLVFEVIANSPETRARVEPELERIYIEQFGRSPVKSEVEDYGKLLRFLSDAGNKELTSKISLANQLRDEAGSYFRQEKPIEAEKILGQAISKGVPSAGVWHDYGISLYRQGRYEESIPAYHRAIDLNSTDDGLFFWSCSDLHFIYSKLAEGDTKHLQIAYEYFSNVTKVYPNRWRGWYETGWMAWKLERFEEAIPYFHKAIQLLDDNNWVWCHDDLKYCYYALAQKNPEFYDKGINYFMEETRIHPERWIAWNQCGWLMWKSGKPLDAIPVLQKAIQFLRDDNWPWCHDNLKSCYYDLAEKDAEFYNKGINYFLGEIKKYPERWVAWNPCGWLMWKSGKPIDAIPYFQKVIESVSRTQWVWSALDLLDVYRQTNQNEQAYNYYTGLLKEKPDYWEIWHAKAWLEWKYKNNLEEAIRSYRRSIELRGAGWVWSLVDLGDCLKENGDIEGARQSYKIAAKEDPQHNAPKARLANIGE
jgi:tetratricopeptide (TPR) repeat protein